MTDVWKFVDRPEASPTVLLDMHNGTTWRRLREGFDISPPPLRQSVAINNLTDGGLLTSTNADLRELKFSLLLGGATEDDRADQLKALGAQLAKPANLLMHQPENASFPVFFRTLRSDDPVFQYEVVPGRWQVDCSVLAEPYAIGVRHDITAGAVVNNDPAAASNPTRLDITGVRGDSPAPAVVQLSSGFGAGACFELAQRTANSPTALTVVAQAEAGSMGTDTTVQANDAAMSGAGSNFVRCTFANNNLVTRLTVSVPTATSAEALRGRYRVYVRVRRSASTSAFLLRYRVTGSTGPQVTWATSMANLWHLDLGLVDLPSFGPAPDSIGYSGLAAAYTPLTLEIQAQRSSGALNLDIDYVYLLPADERQCSFQQVGAANSIVLDGPINKVYGMASGSTPFDPAVANRTVDNAGALMPMIGGMPMLVPGVTNRLYLLRTQAAVTATATVGVSYWPRWREVATS